MLSNRLKNIWVYLNAVDMRLGYDGLLGLVKGIHSSPLGGDFFVFLSKDRKKVKVLNFDGTGLVLISKRLEKGRFAEIFSRGRITESEFTLFFEGCHQVQKRLAPPTFFEAYA